MRPLAPVATMAFLYPGVDHAFFNDTGGRYDPAQAAAADVLAWLREGFGG